MKPPKTRTGLRLRIYVKPDVLLGPGRADLLEGIRDTGSIAAAGRRMSMSYKRAWSLIETMNSEFGADVVSGVKGGAHGGGSKLTALGEELVTRYRSMEKATQAAIRGDLAALTRKLSVIANKK
jgi:molybdate transport system regulatory protein